MPRAAASRDQSTARQAPPNSNDEEGEEEEEEGVGEADDEQPLVRGAHHRLNRKRYTQPRLPSSTLRVYLALTTLVLLAAAYRWTDLLSSSSPLLLWLFSIPPSTPPPPPPLTESEVDAFAFWWLDPALNKWPSAALQHSHLLHLASLHSITPTTTHLPPLTLPPYPPPLNSSLSPFPPLTAFHSALTSPPPPPSSYYSALLYDSFLSLPFLTPTSALPGPLSLSSAAFRHVRLIDGRLHLHLPPPSFIPPPLLSPSPPPLVEPYPTPTDPPTFPTLCTAHPPYPYEPYVDAQCTDAFEPSPWSHRLLPEHRYTLRGLRAWSNSTRWPLPSHHSARTPTPSPNTTSQPPHTPSSTPLGTPISFAAFDGWCHATQVDYPRRSHGRLPYHPNPYTMLQHSTHSLLRLVHQTTTTPTLPPSLSTGLMNPDLNFLPLTVDLTPLDYADPVQCAEVVDHEYVVDSRWTANAWHTFGDWIVPLATLLHDPCFFPLDVPMEALQGKGVRGGEGEGKEEWYWNTTRYDREGEGGVEEGRRPPLPHARLRREGWVPRRDSRVLSGPQAPDHLLATEHRHFISQHRTADPGPTFLAPLSPGSPLPPISSVNSSRTLGPVCIKDAVVGVPWYFLLPTWTFIGLDADRREWEQYRMEEHLRRMDEVIDEFARRIEAKEVGWRGEGRMVRVEEYGRLRARLDAHLVQRGMPVTPPPLPVEWFGQDIGPLGWVPPSHKQWLAAHPQYKGSEEADRWLRRLAPHRQATGGVFRADVGRPFTEEEADALLERAAYHHADHPLHAGVKRRVAEERREVPSRLRLLLLERRRSRFLRHVEMVKATAEAVGFSVTVVDFDWLSQLHEWRNRVELVRSVDVLVAVHGAGLVNLVHMAPNAGLVVELFPECWCFNDPGRSMYGGRLAVYTQVRSLVVGVPCPLLASAVAECQPTLSDAQLVERGVMLNRSTYADEAEVRQSVGALLSHIAVHFLALPRTQVVEARHPLVQMHGDDV